MLDMEKIGIYVHIPFCVSKCKYCNFVSFTNKENFIPEYLKALVKEIELKSKEVKNIIDTIYIGGGTPSCLPNGAISTILNSIKTNFKVDPNAEITIECNPNSVDYTKAQEWINCGVNRVSVGLQSIKQSLLKLIGRVHTKQDYVNAINILHSVGFKNINTDVMIGLPKQKQSDVKNTLLAVAKQNVTHISCYSLILENNTPLYNAVKNKEIKELSEEKAINMYAFAYKFLTKLGFNRYEVSNFAIKGYECKHNINCWNLHQYLGFGVSAHSYFKNIRYSNATTIEDYIALINKNGNAVVEKEKQTINDKIEEYIMLGLRLKNGIDVSYLKEKFDYDILKEKSLTIEKLKKLNLIEIKNNRLYATDLGFYVLNTIILELI